jgi:pimeloyl-ACP methyl ester carboxylesterase
MSAYPSREGFADTGPGRIFYRVAGTRGSLPDVVLEAGGLTTVRSWSAVESVLAPHTRVLSYDRAGLGRSPADGRGCGADAVSDRLVRLLQATGFDEPFLLAGYSLGGAYARCFAARHPQRVAGLALIDTTPQDYVVPADLQRQAIFRMKLLHWAVRLGLGKLLWLATGRTVRSDQLAATIAELGAPDFLPNALAELAAIPGVLAAIRDQASEIAHPTLSVIAGDKPKQISDDDWAKLHAQHRALHARAPQGTSRFEVFAAANHSTLVSHPVNGAALGELLLDFIRSLPKRDSCSREHLGSLLPRSE